MTRQRTPLGLSTTQRGYGRAHQQERARLAPSVATGQAECTELICLEEQDGYGRVIEAESDWDLAHNRATGEYRGPAHRRCNRAEGARYRNTQPTPLRWVV